MIHASANRQESAGTAIAFPRMGSRSWCSGALTALAVVLALPSLAVAQTNGTWTRTANGTYTWSDTANWSGGIVAGGTGSVASLVADTGAGSGNTSTAQTINLNATVTTGTLRWADTNATGVTYGYGIAPGTGGALNMATSDGSTPTILFTGTSQNQLLLISAPITGTQGLRISSTATPSGSLFGQVNLSGTSTFTGNITIDGATTNNFNLIDAGRLGATGTFAGDISIGTGAMVGAWHRGLQTLSGNISGAGGIRMLGSTYSTGTLALTGSNALTGQIAVNNSAAGNATQGRVLLLGNANAMRNAILATSTSALENAGTRTVQFATGIGTFNLGGITAGGLGTGNIGLTDTANSAITLAVGHNNAASSYSGTFFGAGNLTKVGSGTLTLSAANTYTGTTAVNAGVLVMNNAAALGTGTVTFGGGTLQYGSSITTDLSGRIAASGSAIAVDTGANNVAWATGLASTNTGGLTKLGSGALTLSEANNYSGGTTIRNGSVAVTTPANLGSGTIAITPDAGTSTPSLRLNNTVSGTYTQPITMSSINNPAFAVVDASSATAQVTLSGGITVSNNAFLVRLVAPTGTTGSLVVDGNITGTGDLQLTGGGGAGVIQKDINIGSAVLYVAAAGSTWSIGGGAYTWGTTNIQLATSALRTTVDGVLPSSSALSFNSAAGALDINGTRQTVGSVGGSVAGSRIILGSGTLTVSNTDASSFAGVISGAGGSLVKTSSGTLALSGTNTYTGPTAVNAGVLQIGSNGTAGGLAASSAITGSSGATLAFNRTDNYDGNFTNAISGGLGVRVNSGTLTLSASNAYTGGSTISAGRLVVGDVNALGASTSTLAVNGGTLDLAGRSISVGALSGSSGATITTSSAAGTATLTTTVNSNSTFAGSIADNGSGRVALTKTGSSANVLTLTGINTFTGDISVAGGFLDLGTTGLLGSGSYGGNISISSAGGGQFRIMANANQTLSGTISGDGTLWMVTGGAGTGTTTLTAANTFTGQVLAGNNFSSSGFVVPTLQLGNANALQSARLAVSASNKLVFSPGIGTFNVGSLEASGTLQGDLTLQDTSGAAITLSAGGNNLSTTYARVLSGSGGLTKVGSGTLTLSAANTYTGTTAVNAGVLSMGNASALGTGTITFGGGTLQYGSGITADLSGRIAASGSAIAVDTGANNVEWATGLASTNTGGLTKLGSGVLTLSAATNYSGGTTIRNGALAVTSPANLGSGTVAITPDAGTSNPALRLNNTASGTYTQPITMSSISNPAFAVVDASSATAQVTLSGGITVSNNAFLVRLVAPTGTTGSLVVDGNITGTGDLQLMGNGGAGVIQKDVNIGSATLNVAGAGSTWSIGGGAYTWGATNIQFATSTLRTTADGVLPSASALLFFNAAGALDINGTRQTVGSVGNSVAGSRIILGSGTLTVSNTNASTFAGVISGAGGGLVKTNSGTLTLSGSSTYSGATTIAAGRLVVGNAAALGASSAALAVNGGTLDLGGFSVNVGALSGSAGAVITTGSTAGTATLTSAVASGTSIFGGVIQNNGSGLVALTKSGAGVLDLLGANTYSGATSVSAGTLLVTGQLGNTAVTVDSGATLGGSGLIAGAVTVNGLFSPGTSPGLLTVGALTLGTSGTSLFEIDGLTRGSQYDGTNVTGALTYGGSLVIDFGSMITEAFGDNTIFNLFDFGSYTSAFTSITTASDGSFYGGLAFAPTGAGDTWTATKGSQTLEFTHSTGDLVIVPEPAALALAAIGIAAAAWARRRTHQK